ncbi:MAG TPA: hypothetical protein VIM57_10965 [Luteolibacter sp.]
MSTPTSSHFRVVSPKRRMMLTGLGAGVCAAMVGVLRWPGIEAETETAPAGTSTKPLSQPAGEPSSPPLDTAVEPLLIPARMSREWFLPHLRSDFAVDSHSPLRLVEISMASDLRNGAISYTAFTLLFEGPANCGTPEGIHRLRHETLGDMDLFLSPVGRSTARACYEAAFTLKS